MSFGAVAWLHVKAKPTSRLQERLCFKILRGNQPFIFQLQMVCLSVRWQTWLFIPKNMNEGKCCKACFLLWRNISQDAGIEIFWLNRATNQCKFGNADSFTQTHTKM